MRRLVLHGVFASYVDSETKDILNPLLALSPIGDETSWTAAVPIEFLQEQLANFNKTVQNVVCLVANNCATNKAIAGALGLRLVGCASHRLNLAVQLYLQSHAELVDQVTSAMTRL